MAYNHSEIDKLLASTNKGEAYPMSKEDFIKDAKRYIKAIEEGRMMCDIGSVTSSGMSRTMKFFEMDKCKYTKKYCLSSFYSFFVALGETEVKDSDYFRVNGCGMDMVFHTNYSIIGMLRYMGIISSKRAKVLEQSTPSVI